MRYATAVRHLKSIAEACARLNALVEGGILTAVYAHGRVLDAPGADLPVVDVVFVLALPADELPWGVEPPECGGLVHLLRLDKLPVARCWRPASVPVQNRFIRRPLRIWGYEGAETEALMALAARHAEQFRMPAADPFEEAAWHDRELSLSLGHLRSLRDGYWQDRDWRREHSGDGRRPEDHLWEAVNGYIELLDAAP